MLHQYNSQYMKENMVDTTIETLASDLLRELNVVREVGSRFE